ncbi:MAG TPA: glutathione S-transferase family protein [Candidatus Margulisiibacteriota bacterium]|nr:glutathione S-transferase family protein [Candidatus Margulisiibacteriota bacterium]
MLKLHYHPFSTFSRRVRIALLEKNIPCELVEVDMVARAHRGPAYLALNPYGRVPTLEEDGFILYESTAILEYLEATHPTPPLAPADARGRALVAMHMKLCDIQMARQTGAIIFPKRFLPKDRWDEAAMAQAKKEIEKHLEIVDNQLKGKDYMVGDCYSLVEVCYTPFVEFLPLMEITPPASVATWMRRMLDRPSAQQTKPAA